MTRKQLHTVIMTGVVVLALVLLARHFQFMAATPLPDTQGLLGD